jgi:UDP-glucose:(heptosyl)LPS alpha-1,3-glucosyltransferase
MTQKRSLALLKSGISHSGGLEKYAMRTARAFASAGFDVSILTTTPSHEAKKPHPDDSNIEIVDLGKTASLSYLHVKQFDKMCNQWLSRNHAEIIFGMDRNTYQTHYRAGNGVHAAYLRQRSLCEGTLKKFSFKVNPLHHLILEMERTAFEHPRLKALFTNSHMVKQEILKYYRTPEQKIHVIHNGVEWAEMQAPFESWQEQKPLICRQLNLDPSLFQLLFIGHGYRRKGLQHLLEALFSLKRRDFQLSVIGKDKEEGFFKQMVSASNLEKQVKFFGPRGDVMRFYQMADALAIPSTYDPFANVTVEALAMGLFIVSSPYNGGSEVLNRDNGVVIQDLFNRDAVATAIEQALDRPKSPQSAPHIRQGVQGLDFSTQMEKLVRLSTDVS